MIIVKNELPNPCANKKSEGLAIRKSQLEALSVPLNGTTAKRLYVLRLNH